LQIFDGQLRFGIHSGQQNATFDQYLHLWKTAEALGFDWASVFDHFMPMPQSGGPPGPCFEGMTMLAAMAAHTERLRCGNLVVGVTYRNPAVLAKEGATIDQISGGRLELGIGGGWYEQEHDQYGIPFPPTGTRIKMMTEVAQILKSLWTQEKTTFKGRYYTITEALCDPKCVQQPHAPIWIGGAGEQLTLRAVARYADGWNTFAMETDAYRHKLDVLAGHCREAGRDPGDIRKSLVFGLTLVESADEARHARERAGSGGRRAGFVGTPDECVEYLKPYLDLGVGDFLLRATAAQGPEDWRTMELYARQVMPAVKSLARG